MHDLLTAISRHGYLLVFLIVFAEACGLPSPAALTLVIAGAAAASHLLSFPFVFAISFAAMLLGDLLLFCLGRYTGWALLAVLCRLSLNPETCILLSAEWFYKRGRVTLIFAKFIPGVNTMAPPLAGSMKMRTLQFLQLDIIGASLYVLAYSALGYVSRPFIVGLTRRLQNAQHVFAEVILLGLAAYLVYRFIQYHRYKLSDVVPRVKVSEIALRMQNGEKDGVLIVDVRSHGYYDSGADRIAGSVRLEPNRLNEELKTLPKDKDIYVYCT
jgi:membrane protein DedA with SNARE-associated domain